MRLLTAHKLLIGAGIALGVLLLPWGLRRWRTTGDVGALALGVAGGVVALALAVYLRHAVRRYRRLAE